MVEWNSFERKNGMESSCAEGRCPPITHKSKEEEKESKSTKWKQIHFIAFIVDCLSFMKREKTRREVNWMALARVGCSANSSSFLLHKERKEKMNCWLAAPMVIGLVPHFASFSSLPSSLFFHSHSRKRDWLAAPFIQLRSLFFPSTPVN